MLIDTGSDYSFISDRVIDNFVINDCSTFTCISFCGDYKDVSKYCEVQGLVDNKIISGKFFITSLPQNFDFICGSDILTSHKSIIRYHPIPSVEFTSTLGNVSTAVANNPVKNIEFSDTLSEKQSNELFSLLNSYADCFSKGPHDLGRTNVDKHVINTDNNTPIKLNPYKLPHGLKEESDKIVNEMLNNGIIQPSKSPWCNPYFLIKKKNGTYRFVLNYRKLNEVTKKDAFPIPLVEDIFADLNGTCIFSSLDLASGYWQIEMEESSKEKTAFAVNNGLFEFNVMPYGVCNGPSTFQRVMQTVLAGAPCLPPYIDDIVIASKSWGEHMESIDQVLSKLKIAGLKLNPDKCSWARDNIVYLGHLLSKDGIRPDPKKIESLMNMKAPTSPKEAQIVYGFCNYLRSYVPNFAHLLKPVSDCLHMKTKDFKWTEEANSAFEQMKFIIADNCLRQYPDFTKIFEVSVDASSIAIGASLAQEGKPIIFDSRVLTQSERNYSTTDREYLGLVWAFKKFRHYLVNQNCIVKTDHKPLLGLVKGKPQNGRHARYQQILEEFQFQFQYIPGPENIIADALSRLVEDPEEKPEVSVSASATVDTYYSEIKLEQENDNECKHIKQCLLNDIDFQSPLRCVNEWYIDENGVLGHTNRIFVPYPKRLPLIKMFHEFGHFGIAGTVGKIRERYIFPNMWKLTSNFIKGCRTCQQEKNYGSSKAPLMNLPKPGPFEFVCIDLVGPISLGGNYKYILTMIDNYSNWAEAVPLCNIDANSVAKAFIKHWIYRWGPPVDIHSDQGTQFESNVVSTISDLLGIKKSRTTAYHPEGNGTVERLHRTLKDRLRCNGSNNWKDLIDEVLFEFRIVPNSTGNSPMKTLFGFDVCIPSDWPEKYVRSYYEPSIHMLHNGFSNASNKQKDINFTNKFKVGDSVWVKNLNRTAKESPWNGPFKIDKIMGPVTISVESMGSIHVNRIKLAT